ncbi:UPF0764 protein C16orf89 homolog [Oculina patagonica]
MKLACLFLLLFSVGSLLEIAHTNEGQEEFPSGVNSVLDALEKAVLFYEQYGDDLNLDAYFGLRIAQGNLFDLIRKKKTANALHKSGIYKQVTRLQELVSRIGSKSLTVLRRSNPQYYNLVGFTVSQPWLTVKHYKRIDPNLSTAFDKRKLSDDILHDYEPCLAKLLGSPGYGDKPCDVPEECWEIMVRPGEIGFVLTHQALYFLFGEQRGCLDTFSTKMKEYKSSLEHVYDKICSNIYTQLQLVERVHPIRRIDADLMMEQSVVCGILGYYEFLTPQRLSNVLQWQRSSGCYGNIENEDEFNKQQSRRTMRKLLMGKELSDGCESHITGVGTALLSIYFRFLVLNDIPDTNSTMAKKRT